MKNLIRGFLFVLISSCENYDPSSTNKTSTIEHFNSNHFVENTKAVVLDFSKTENKFIKDIEHKLGEDLCDKGHFIGQIEIKGKAVQFDAFIPKYCETYPPVCNKHFISSYIKPDNDILVRWNGVNQISDVQKLITEITKENLSYGYKETVVYALNWSENTNPKKTKQLLYEILKASENYKIKNEYFNTLIYLETYPFIIPPSPPPPPLK